MTFRSTFFSDVRSCEQSGGNSGRDFDASPQKQNCDSELICNFLHLLYDHIKILLFPKGKKMFSNELDFEQSEKLVELIYKMAQIDSQYDFDEESFVEQLKFEFDVEKIPDTGSVNDLIDYFSSKSEKIKKIVLFHVIYLIDSDQYLSENETEAFNYLTDQFELGSDIVDSAKELVKDVMDVNLRLSEYIM